MARTSVIASVLALGVLGSACAAPQQQELPPAQAPTAPGQLSPDTTVRLFLVERLKSGAAKKGDRVRFEVSDDVVDPSGAVLIRKGTPAYGTVTTSKGSGTFGKSGKLEVTIDQTTAVDGQQVRLRGSKSGRGKGSTGAAVAVSALVFLPAGFFMKGKNLSVDPGTPFMAYVDSPVTVKTGKPAGEETAAKVDGPRKSIVLRNGDKLTGRIAGLADGVYTIVTDNGTLKVKEGDVSQIADAD